jgi:CysZ protein
VKAFFSGVRFYYSGVRYWTSKPVLLRLSIIPWFINFACFVIGMVLAFTYLPSLMSLIMARPDLWYQYIAFYLLGFLTACALSVLVMFCVFVAAQILSFPFNDMIAEKTLELTQLLPVRPPGVKAKFKRSIKNILTMLKKTVVLILIAGALVFAALIPGLGIIGACVSVVFIAWDLMDYTFDHFEDTLSQRIAFIKQNKAVIFGFSLGLGLTSMIPVINFLLVPAHVTAAALMVANLKKTETSLERNHPPTTR